MRDFKNLQVWQKSHQLTLNIYRATEGFPRSEMFGLTSQVRRAASSIEANLAEGCGRTQAEFARFIQIALGSNCEVECHLLLARDLSLLADDSHRRLSSQVEEVRRMLNALLKTIRRPTSTHAQDSA
ncbi:MAG: four helix bundle protein [Candidatus Korobacteraceae bacterium]